MQYIENADSGVICIFCDKPVQSCDEENLILHRGPLAFVILNAFPYSNGHLLVAPYQHTADLNDLQPVALLEMMDLTRRSINLLTRAFHPDGFNVGINMGRVAGAGIADHIHLHIVPRWSGDTNFMPVLADARVLPESLRQTYRRLQSIAGIAYGGDNSTGG